MAAQNNKHKARTNGRWQFKDGSHKKNQGAVKKAARQKAATNKQMAKKRAKQNSGERYPPPYFF